MTTVVFAGPSLWGFLDHVPDTIALRPPARCGDLWTAVQDGATRIGLIDGLFGDCRSVWHKEILLILSHGIPVLGAASMGALRAAECAPFGMQGVGQIYDDYASGRRVADADVAMLHGPDETEFQPLTVPLVDVEDVLATLRSHESLTLAEADALLRVASDLNFRRRTWKRVCAASGLSLERQDRLRDLARAIRPTLKTRDALALVAALPSALPPPPGPVVPMTSYLARLTAKSA